MSQYPTSPRKFKLDAIHPNGLSFVEVAMMCVSHVEFVQQFDRLTVSNLQRRGSPLDLAIDKASGRFDDDLERFLNFVWECVFIRLPMPEASGSK